MRKRTGYGRVRIAVAKIHKIITSPGRTADQESEAKLGFELFTEGEPRLGWILTMSYASDKMDPTELVKICEILNPNNKPRILTIIACMGAEKLRLKMPHLIRAVRQACLIVTWVSDPMDGNTIKAPSGLKTCLFDAIQEELSTFFDVHEEDRAEFVNIVLNFFDVHEEDKAEFVNIVLNFLMFMNKTGQNLLTLFMSCQDFKLNVSTMYISIEFLDCMFSCEVNGANRCLQSNSSDLLKHMLQENADVELMLSSCYNLPFFHLSA